MALSASVEGRVRRDGEDSDRRLPDAEVDEPSTPPLPCPSLADWSRLGRPARRFVETMFVSMETAHTMLADRLFDPAVAETESTNSQTQATLQECGRERLRQAHTFRRLNHRLGFIGNDSLYADARSHLRGLLARIAPSGDWQAPSRPPGLLLAVDTAVTGVLFDTNFEAVETVLDRRDVLPDLADACSQLRVETRTSIEATQPLLTRLRTDGGDIAATIEAAFDRAVIPCVQWIRSLERSFDVLALGLLPDEMVADSLDRFFELTSLSNGTPSPPRPMSATLDG